MLCKMSIKIIRFYSSTFFVSAREDIAGKRRELHPRDEPVRVHAFRFGVLARLQFYVMHFQNNHRSQSFLYINFPQEHALGGRST